MCYRVVSAYHSTTEFVPKCYKTQEMCDKSYNSFFLHLFIFLINIKVKKCVAGLFLKILL